MVSRPLSNNALLVMDTLAGVTDPGLRRWLSRGTVAFDDGPRTVVRELARELGLPDSVEGAAAFRFLGSTGTAPTGWLCAAEPVYLEPRMNHLCLHSQTDRFTGSEAAALAEFLNQTFDGDARFVAAGPSLYLSAPQMRVAAHDADAMHGFVPNEFLPAGEDGRRHRSLTSEIEMALHEHAVNRERAAEGRQPVNSLWLWGGGTLPAVDRPLPAAAADDDLINGIWQQAGSATRTWSTDFDLDRVPVNVAPIGVERDSNKLVARFRQAFIDSSRPAFTVLTRDGLTVRATRRDRFKVWRRPSRLFDAGRGQNVG